MKKLLALGIVLALTSLACTVALFEQPGTATSDGTAPSTAADGTSTDATTGEAQLPPAIQAGTEEELLIAIYERVNPAVVNIDVGADTGQGDVADFGSGSGFIIDDQGHIVTNGHVVADADQIWVTFSDGEVLPAQLVGEDPYADLAVIQPDLPEGYEVTALELGDSNNLKVGQRVIAIGNPFGLTGSMTVGIISAVGRTLPSAVSTQAGIFSNPLIIQTDAAINPGNSGGPLLNSSGQVIGVNAAIRSTSGVNTGIGFAIPVNTVKLIAPQLIENGEAVYPYLGISSQTSFPLSALADEFDLPVREGVLIATVSPDSGSARAGLRGGDETVAFRGAQLQMGGDIITAIDGVPIANFDELLGYLVSNTQVGDTIVLTIIRDGTTMDVEVTLTARPEE